jgi:hypothetical protein
MILRKVTSWRSHLSRYGSDFGDGVAQSQQPYPLEENVFLGFLADAKVRHSARVPAIAA